MQNHLETGSLNSEVQQKSSWDLLRERTRDLWNQKRQAGKRVRFGHPDEFAEHLVFEIKDFVANLQTLPNRQERELELKKLISQARYEDVIDRGQQYYASEYRPLNPNENPSLIEKLISSYS